MVLFAKASSKQMETIKDILHEFFQVSGQKITFKLVLRPDKLWAQVLRSKYKWRGLVPDNIILRNCSRLWKGVSTVWSDVKSSLVWTVGNGRSIDFWRDPWLSDIGPLKNHLLNQQDGSNLPATTVAEMIDEQGKWRWPIIYETLPVQIIHRLKATMTLKQVQQMDTPGWKWQPNRKFTVCSAYQIQTENYSGPTEKIWQTIAKYRGLQRIKIFLWLLASGKLLTNSERVRRHMDTQAKCGLCGATEETINHLFRTCPLALEAWKRLVQQEKLSEFLTLGIKKRILTNLLQPSCFAVDEKEWDLMFDETNLMTNKIKSCSKRLAMAPSDLAEQPEIFPTNSPELGTGAKTSERGHCGGASVGKNEDILGEFPCGETGGEAETAGSLVTVCKLDRKTRNGTKATNKVVLVVDMGVFGSGDGD
ncbi:hypothetical protein F3Y22_tig00113124pilonHSYRG00408 [Hibiscus syriacus]|uniref:Reverse transcriptase zinc-binding domain-containing protein n=1 Tax=Hibiscus syriacus TaxID=106335 RepID=A0A6A2X709_HIBSY|nr:hypothetical protein F3Y22_tig00113124pilonHSYRG00408 [Hibiscus syriacus]